MESADRPSASSALDCDLCIVGAGYAALNGLNAAAKYLPAGARVVMIDKNESWGGQWLRQYDFVRLHQPYPMFTAGDQPWKIPGRDPAHLATKREVIDHLATVPRVSAGHLEVQPLFGHAYESHRVEDGRVVLDAAPVANGGAKVRVRAKRLLKGTGVDIQMLPAFPISSSRVRSVAVSDPVVGSPELLDSDAPVVVIGSGKTAMDLVLHLVRKSRPGRRVSIVIGSGMWFFSRDAGYPRGARRWIAGTLAGDIFIRMVQRYEGHNERDVADDLARSGLLHNVFGDGGNCRYGLLGVAERDEVLAGVAEVFRGHLLDVDGTRMTIRDRDGTTRATDVDPGTWFINCTSHFRHVPHEPVLTDGGLVAAPQFTLGFSGTSAYFVTHLWYRDDLAPIAPALHRIRIDVQPKLRFLPEVGVMVMANMARITERLPMKITARFLGDYNKWYPFARQLPMITRMMRSKRMFLDKAERFLPLRFGDAPDPA